MFRSSSLGASFPFCCLEVGLRGAFQCSGGAVLSRSKIIPDPLWCVVGEALVAENQINGTWAVELCAAVGHVARDMLDYWVFPKVAYFGLPPLLQREKGSLWALPFLD